MGVLTYVLKAGAKGLAKTKGTNEYWDSWHTLKHSPHLVVKAAHGIHKAVTKVKDAPLPYTKAHSQRLVSRLAADDRVPKLDPVVNAKQGVKELAKSHVVRVNGKEITIGPDEHVSNSYLEYLLQHVKGKESIKLIRSYVQSNAADNLTPHERTELLIKCMEKLRYLDMIHQFFYGVIMCRKWILSRTGESQSINYRNF